ncbi:MAG: hypothetical protein QME21_08640 [Anaerolineales bacterium]|jgi:uncharacterized protein YxjI|nr:hypothetical protein [Anaerolineales bacterium]
MNTAIFQHSHYLLRRKVLALTGTFRIYTPNGELAFFSQQKMFRLREDIRIWAEETRIHELLRIHARQVIDISATYDVYDAVLNTRLGALRRRGLHSLARDTWEVLDLNDQPIGLLQEDSLGRALLRRILLGSLLPQDYDLFIGEQRVADFRQRFNLFRYEMDLDFSMDTQNCLDRRLGIAAAILLGTIEGRQE